MAVKRETIQEYVIPLMERDLKKIQEGIDNLKEAVANTSIPSEKISQIFRGLIGDAASIRNRASTWVDG